MGKENLSFVGLLKPNLLNILPPRSSAKFKTKIVGITLLGAVLFAVTFVLSYKVLGYFHSIEIIGNVLLYKILYLLLTTFFTLLIFSNLITSLGTFFLSADLELLATTPLTLNKIFNIKYTITNIISSWMVYVFALPVFIAYGVIFNVSFDFYIVLLILLFPFIIIASSVGSWITFFLINVFPARRLRDIFLLTSVIFGAGIVLLFRVIRPERLVNPEYLNSIGSYVSSLGSENVKFLPSTIINEILVNMSRGNPLQWDKFLFVIYSGLVFLLITKKLFFISFRPGLSKAHEGKHSEKRTRTKAILRFLTFPLSPVKRQFLLKDTNMFFRDASQWSQLLLLLTLIIIYLYNFSVLPLEKSPLGSEKTANIIGFANIILAGFVLASLGARFIFPMISIESRSIWLIKGAPLRAKDFISIKFLQGVIPIVITGFIITYLSCRFLNTRPLITYISTVTILLMGIGITALALFFGTYYPVLKFENTAQIAASFGGILYMMIALFYILVQTGLIAYPTYLLYRLQSPNIQVKTTDYLIPSFYYLIPLTIFAISYILPIKFATKKFEKLQL